MIGGRKYKKYIKRTFGNSMFSKVLLIKSDGINLIRDRCYVNLLNDGVFDGLSNRILGI